jgi:teichuronic acid biosynthesis glycosyltransferase TuaC
MKEELNIILLSNLFPNEMEPVRGMFNYQLARGLSNNCKLSVICPLPYFPKFRLLSKMKRWYNFSKVPRKYLWEGIVVYSPKYIIFPKISEILHSVLLFYPIYQTLKYLKSKRCVDLVNAHYVYPDGVAAYWACRFLEIPVVLSALGSDINYYARQPIISKQILHALEQCSGITSVSRDLGNKIQKMGIKNNKIEVILNGVNMSLFQIRQKEESRNILSIEPYKNVMLYVGRLSEEKGLTTLIDAVSLLGKEGINNLIVIIVGDGPLRESLQNEVNNKGLKSCFRFLGFQNLDSISVWLGASDLLCLPSLSEGCPNVIMEALSAGRPVVASRVGGIPELVTDGINGLLFNPGQTEQLSNAIKKAFSIQWDPVKLRVSIASRSWDKVAMEYHNVYEKVLSNFN